MSTEYRNNHYVPIWYQRRFLPPGQTNQELYYLDLNPQKHIDARGVVHPGKAIRKKGVNVCFLERDLYTTHFGAEVSTEIEQQFFGEIDRNGHKAVEYFEHFAHPSVSHDAFRAMILYLSTQKLRTPKGLGWLKEKLGATSSASVLREMVRYRDLHCALYTECVWLIADASNSATKFMISDHPVTVYNRRCGPRSDWCRGFNDPEVWFQGTHTIFPLSLEKLLILTNLSWVRNPYQLPTAARPNPNPWRSAIFKFTDIQTLRHLSEQEVREINFILKARAWRYVAAANEEWLYPERHVSKADWSNFGYGYLLMPDPRPVHLGGEVLWGGAGGAWGSVDAYGRRPSEKDYNKESDSNEEAASLYRFKGEFARLFGPCRRGRSFEGDQLDREQDRDDYHQYHLKMEKEYRRFRRI